MLACGGAALARLVGTGVTEPASSSSSSSSRVTRRAALPSRRRVVPGAISEPSSPGGSKKSNPVAGGDNATISSLHDYDEDQYKKTIHDQGED